MRNKGFGVIEMLLVLGIMGAIAYFMLQRYSQGPVADEQAEAILVEQGIKVESHQAIVDSTKVMIKGLEQQQAEQLEQFYKSQK